MIRALWFLVKISALIALAVWVADRPGSVRIEWMEYVFTIHVGMFLLIGLATILLSIFVYQTIKGFIDFPKSYRRYKEIKGQEKGYQALTLGLTAVAAGDTKAAVREAKRASKLLPNDTGLPLLLEAQAARLDGREEDAMRCFVGLLEDKDASFLGVRGLLQASLDVQDYETALAVSDKALALHPKQPWILKIAYDLNVRARDWEKARTILYRAQKAGAIEEVRANADRAAMMIAESDQDLAAGRNDAALKKLKKAASFDEGFAPAIIALVRYHQDKGENRKAKNVIEKAWKKVPHEAYVSVWNELLADDKATDALARLRHFERLVKINGSVALLQCRAGEAAMQAGLWGEARDYFVRAEGLKPSALLYRLWAELEERSTHDEEAIKEWLGKAVSAPGERSWICRETGRAYEDWHVIAEPHGSFNTIEWLDPAGLGEAVILLNELADADMAEALLEAPAA